MAYWQNWSGRHQAKPGALQFVRSVDDAAALVAEAAGKGQSIRAAGAGHSHQPLIPNDGVIIDTSGLAGVISVDEDAAQAWIRAGSTIYSLGGQLHEHGLALKNQGDIDRQLLAGAVSTGTHGTGKNLKNISASVVAMQVITADGEVRECSADENADLFQVARLSVGSVGLITAIRMQLRQSCVLKESGFQASLADIRPRIDELAVEHERFEFFWYPQTDEATVKIIDETAEAPQYPLADEGARHAWSYEVLPSHRPHPHTEMEYSVPADQGPACLDEIVSLLRNDFPDVMWPVEYRTVAADDLWLSMASGRDTVTISIHQDVRVDETDYYKAAEAIFRRYDGRPHWGKVNYLDADEFRSTYPHWDEWWQVRNRYDQDGRFLNDYMRGLAPA